MNKLLSSLIAFSLMGLSAFIIGCDPARPTAGPDPAPPGELRISAPFAGQTTAFAFDLTRRVNEAAGASKNVFISPLSLHLALGMVLNGANGQTAQEIGQTLKLDAQTLTEANQTYQNVLKNLPIVDPNVEVGLANSVWYRNTFSVEKPFLDLVRETFQAEVTAQNFADPATVTTINNWASRQTNGRVPKLIESIGSDEVMFLLNAVYFKGNWKTRFDAAQTTDHPFTLSDGTTKSVRMMQLKAEFRRAAGTNYTALELPYGSDKFAMTLLLPSEENTAEAVLASLTASEWTRINGALTKGSVTVGLPKFTLNGLSYDLSDQLKQMGMPTAFSQRADFSKLSSAEQAYLSSVKQGTFVAVDEQGTEAAAATSVGIGVTAVSPTDFFLCNRPFVFIIHEKASGTILFVGKVADPTRTNA